MKTAVCAIAKLENHYIREWVEYHKKIGFDHVFLYDNNDLDGERLATELQDYIDSNYITIIEAFGIIGYQVEAYNKLYQSEAIKEYDWVMFIDIDEFVTFLDKTMTVNRFIEENPNIFNKAISIGVQWHFMDDNDLARVENNNYSVLNRFTHDPHNIAQSWCYKQIVRTNVPGLTINSAHLIREKSMEHETGLVLTNDVEYVKTLTDTLGRTLYRDIGYPEVFKGQTCPMFLRHFQYKTIQEYIELKLKRGYPMPHKNFGKGLGLYDFFFTNKPTIEKIQVVKEWFESGKIPDKIVEEQLSYLAIMLPEDLYNILDPTHKIIVKRYRENQQRNK